MPSTSGARRRNRALPSGRYRIPGLQPGPPLRSRGPSRSGPAHVFTHLSCSRQTRVTLGSHPPGHDLHRRPRTLLRGVHLSVPRAGRRRPRAGVDSCRGPRLAPTLGSPAAAPSGGDHLLSPSPSGYSDAAIDLGKLKATDGSFSYELPTGTELSSLASVVIWCEPFAVQFAHAELEAP